MQSLDKRRVDYFTPDVPPTEEAALPEWLFNQVTNLSESISNVNSMHLTEMYHWPEGYKPREGDIVWAGEGLLGEESPSGIYAYMHGVWVPVSGGESGGGVPIGGIIMWSGSIVPDSWALCDGTDAPDGTPTPDLVSQFVKGSILSDIGNKGGSSTTGGHSITENEMPSHKHSLSIDTNEVGDHNHGSITDSRGTHNHGGPNFIVGPGISIGTGSGSSAVAGLGANAVIGNDGNHYHSISTDGNHAHNVNGHTASSGSGNAHSHSFEPQYYQLAYIMRYE